MSWVKELKCFPETPLEFLLRSTPGTGARRLGALGDLWKTSTLPLSLTVQRSQRHHRVLCIQSPDIQVRRLRELRDTEKPTC